MNQKPPPNRTTPETIFATASFWSLLGLLVVLIAAGGPVLTSDGLAHVSMANFIAHAGDPAWPMINRLYQLNLVPSPNAFGDLLLAGLMLIVPPLIAERLVQLLCLISILLAARLTLRRIDPTSKWISLFFFPVALERMFFLGLYNFCLSLTGCILCIWAYLGLRERVSGARAVGLAVLLFVTLACQAAGWMEAALAIGAMALIETIRRWRSTRRQWEVLRFPMVVLASLIPGAALFVLFALAGPGDRHMTYGPPPLDRLTAVFRGDAFAPIGQSTAYASLVMGLTLLVLAAAGATVQYLGRAANDRRPWSALCMPPLAFLGLLLVIPDEAGGGWTHTWRAQVFPYVGLAFACAALPAARLLKVLAIAAASAGSLVMIAMAFWVQIREVPPVLHEFNEADAFIGPHCTVAPILAQFKLDPENSAQLFYHPMFHIANRFELRSDRPVLFSYVARLPIYAVLYRPNTDPQRLLYGWSTGQRDTRVRKIDPDGYEAASGIPVDYILFWDFPERGQPGPYQDMRVAIAAKYRLVHQSSGGRLELYRRSGAGGCAKP